MMDLLGLGEWIVIGFLVLVVIGPKDLPRVLYSWGRWIARLKAHTEGLRQEFDGMMRLEHLKTLDIDPEEGVIVFPKEGVQQDDFSRELPKKNRRRKSLKRL